MTNTEKLKQDFSAIVRSTKFRTPNYDVIEFDEFLFEKEISRKEFIDIDTISVIRKMLKAKYQNDNDCIKTFGTIEYFKFKDLTFYQKEVGISGPMHSQIDDPLFIINYNGSYILLNGYHRVLFNILNHKHESKAYILNVNL